MVPSAQRSGGGTHSSSGGKGPTPPIHRTCCKRRKLVPATQTTEAVHKGELQDSCRAEAVRGSGSRVPALATPSMQLRPVSPCGITRDLFWIKISAWTCELYSADRHAPLDAHHNSLHLQIHDLRGKRDSADWTKVTEPKRRGQPGPSGWAPSKRLRQPTSPHCGHRECDYEGTAREMYPHQGMQVPLGAGTGRGPPLPSRLLKEQSPADTWFERFWPPEG